jgi:hypothetical protein
LSIEERDMQKYVNGRARRVNTDWHFKCSTCGLITCGFYDKDGTRCIICALKGKTTNWNKEIPV